MLNLPHPTMPGFRGTVNQALMIYYLYAGP